MLRATFVYREEWTGDTVQVVHTAPAYDPQRYAETTPELMDLMASNFHPGDGWETLQAEARDADGVLIFSADVGELAAV